MTTIEKMRKKYQRRKRANGVSAYPPGGQDVILMCELVDYAVKVLRVLQPILGEETQKRVDLAIRTIDGDWI
jgi:hypothetical protein